LLDLTGTCGSGDSATADAHARSIKDDVESFEAGDPEHSPTTNARAAAFFAASLGPPPSGDASSRNTPSPDPLLPKALVETHLVRATWECLEADFERATTYWANHDHRVRALATDTGGAAGRRRSVGLLASPPWNRKRADAFDPGRGRCQIVPIGGSTSDRKTGIELRRTMKERGATAAPASRDYRVTA